jgi:hypothetical protein
MSGRRALRLVATALPALVATTHAWAAVPATVIVVRPGDGGEAMAEVATRTRAELVVSGFLTRLLECGPGEARCGADIVAGDPAAPAATVITYRSGVEIVTDVGAAPPGGQAPVVRMTLLSPPDRDPKVLAIRAVELVRAALLEAGTAPPRERVVIQQRDGEVPTPITAPPELAAEPRWAVGLGGSWLESLGGFGAAFGAVARAEYLGMRGLGVAAMLAAAELSPGLAVDLGHLAARQEVAALELAYRLRPGRRLQPRVAAGVGGYRMVARGEPARANVVGASQTVWAGLASAGGGASLMLAPHLALFADGELVFVNPHPVVARAGGLARAGNPSLLVSVGLQRMF